MSTLWKRANGPQYRMLRIISGAVLNTQSAHGEKQDRIFARSVAKRAVGTISAQWAETLAADKLPPSGNRRSDSGPNADNESQVVTTRSRDKHQDHDEMIGSISKPISKRKAVRIARRRLPPRLRHIHKILSAKIAPAKQEGRDEYARGIIETLKLINEYVKKEEAILRAKQNTP